MMAMTCFECGGAARHDHHVIPRSRGGRNTVPLCEACHAKAHHRQRAMSTSRLTKESMQRKKINGERVGQIPYGYDLAADGVTLEANAAEQSVIALVKQLQAAGESVRKIAAELTRRGVMNKNGTTTWHATMVQRLKQR